MSMSISDEGTGLEWAGALGPRGLFPTGAQPAPTPATCGCSRRSRASTAGRGCSLGRSRRGVTARPTLRRLPRPGPVHAVLPPALHGAPRRRRLVVRPRRRARLPGGATSSTSSITTACSASRVADLAHGGRRLADVRRPGRRRRGSRRGPPGSAGRLGHRGRRRGPGADRHRSGAVRRGRGRHPPAPGARHPRRPTTVQRDVLAAIPYSANTALLHTDTRVLPNARNAWASWNFRRPLADASPVQVTYDLTRLQRLPTADPLPGHPRR